MASELAHKTWSAILSEAASGGDRTSAEIIDESFSTLRERCVAAAQEFGTAAYKERQKRFTSKLPRDLIVMQDVADGIADAIQKVNF